MVNPKITLVVAMNKNNAIGVNNNLPWHIPEDLAHFKQITLNKPIIMGRKTFESIGRILPGRENIVITRDIYWHYEGITVFHSLEQAIKDNAFHPEICIIGGGEIFKQALAFADCLYITIIDITLDNADVFFPQVDFTQWQLVNYHQIISKDHSIRCEFKEYIRK
ncbi:MAG: dihydrofolate reductase [Burkholderiales bacterium]|nr:dihydrofolate reductase [Burkholderiales bacterium]